MFDDRQNILDTAWENTNEIVNCITKEKTVEDFLHRENAVILRSSNLTRSEIDTHLNINFDTDGIVLGLRSFAAIKFPVRHLSFFHANGYCMKPVFHLLKKHLPLSRYHLPSLKQSQGFQFFYDCGWECYVSLIPKKQHVWHINPRNILNIFTEITACFRSELWNLARKGTCKNTIQKNSISTSFKFHILPGDQSNIFDSFGQALTKIHLPDAAELYVFVFRFGERITGEINIDTDFNMSEILDQSIHVAATLQGNDNLGLLWSREGLQSIVGERGSLSTCLSFLEAANFQSNIDGKLPDISPDLRRLVCCPSEINFVQFYGDIPHVLPKTRNHPVSGSIVNCGIPNGNVIKSIERDATTYISVLKDNILLLDKLRSRVEFVISPSTINSTLNARSFFNTDNIYLMLKRIPLLVPFDHLDGELCNALKLVGLHIILELKKCFDVGKRLGKYNQTWKAFQYELAIEKILWGRPLNPINIQYSINLGPGCLVPTRSKTDWLGFLALDEYTSSCSNDSPPPLRNWISAPKLNAEVLQLFGYCDYVNSCNDVLGRRSVIIILGDLLSGVNIIPDQKQINSLICNLKSSDVAGQYSCNGMITQAQIVKLLVRAKSVSHRLCTKRMFCLLAQYNKNIEELLSAGLSALELKLFPELKIYDTSRNLNLSWNKRNLLKIITEGGNEDINEASYQAYSQLILQTLGTENYVHASKLSVFQRGTFVFPWIKPILLKLKRAGLNEQDKETILLFCTCVGLLSNHWYVDYRKVAKLSQSLRLSQLHLKGMEIQSKFLLGIFHFTKIWRLHESMTLKLTIPEPNTLVTPIETTTDVSDEIQNDPDDYNLNESSIVIEDDTNTICKINPRRHPSTSKPTWSPDELEIIHTVKEDVNSSLKVKYDEYKKLCLSRGVPDRTFKAFKAKLKRL